MESRRLTRNRPNPSEAGSVRKRNALTSNKRGSPGKTQSGGLSSRLRSSPPRRSSRPRSTVLGSTASKTTSNTPPTPIKERKEEIKGAQKTLTNLPMTLTTNTSTRAPNKLQNTSSVHSSYSSTSQENTEVRSNVSSVEGDVAKIANFIRRSVSKTIGGITSSRGDDTHTPTPTTTTEPESRYSRSMSRSMYEDDKYSKADSSDIENDGANQFEAEDVEENEHYHSFNASQQPPLLSPSSTCRKIEVPREFGGWLGVLMIMLMSPVVYYLQWCCSKYTCTFKQPNLPQSLNTNYLIKNVFKVEAVGAYLALNFSVTILSAILFGRCVRLPTMDRESLEYKFNVFPIALVVTIAAAVAEYLKYPVADFVLKNYMNFCVYGIVNAFIVAFWSYVRTDLLNGKYDTKVNIYGKSGNFLIDFALGRQLNPKCMNLVEYKQIYYRISLITTLLFAECFIYKNVQIPLLPEGEGGPLHILMFYITNIKYNSAALLAASQLLFYVLDNLIFEHHLASSFELQGEGFGCLLLLRYAATPFLLSGVAKYFFDRRIPIACTFAIYVAVGVLVAGLILKRISSAMKYKYRIAPMSPIFSDMPTIHTFQGKRLLLGPLWGRVRQPNYTGDILAMSGLCVPLFLDFAWPPFVGILLCVVVLLHRAQRVNKRNASRYHSSWMRYCNQVRYYLVPKVF